MAKRIRKKFWKTQPISALTSDEWEALCDGCGKCCLLKLEDFDTGAVEYTNIACRLLDEGTCRCSQYEIRKQLVPSCVVITPDTLSDVAYWMPTTCAYRRLHEGKDLPDWHPLVTGNPRSTHEAGMSMINRTVPEFEVEEDEYEDYIVEGLQ
jgi:uncharacterized cysteine cluster protein YcgN (CxxCxxCC family)